MTWAVILFWIIILVGALVRGPLLLYAFVAFGAFGTLDMVPPEVVSGLNMNAQSFCALFLVGKILLVRGNIGRALDVALDPTRLGLLFAFLAYGFLSAYVMPRLFAHMVEVIPVAVTLPWAVLLQPTAANFTQPAYLTLSVGMIVVFTLMGEHLSFQRHYLRALLLGGLVLIGTGLLDMIMSSLGLADLLAPFRNTTGSPLADDHVLDVKRIVGLMPEASSYGGVCCEAAIALAFLRPCFGERLRNWVVPPTVLGLVVMIALSTSSSAYVGLAVSMMVFGANWLRRSFDTCAFAREGLKWEALVLFIAALTFLLLVTFAPAVLDPIYAMIDEMIFKKGESGSYIERNMWTSVGMDAFLATDGIGVGLGSARTSNWFVAILSNTGVIGATLLAAFFVRIFFLRAPSDHRAREFMLALKFALLPTFAMLALAGTTPDIGGTMGAKLGLIMSLAASKRSSPLINRSTIAKMS